MSQEVHDREIKEAVEEALYEFRMVEALRRAPITQRAGRIRRAKNL